MIKAFEIEKIPKHLHFQTLNPHIKFPNDSKIIIPSSDLDWKKDPNKKRYAAVSSFGYSGTNSHLILSDAAKITHDFSPISSFLSRVFSVSASDCKTLSTFASNHLRSIEGILGEEKEGDDEMLMKLCYTSNFARARLSHMICITPKDCVDLKEKLKKINLILEESNQKEQQNIEMISQKMEEMQGVHFGVSSEIVSPFSKESSGKKESTNLLVISSICESYQDCNGMIEQLKIISEKDALFEKSLSQTEKMLQENGMTVKNIESSEFSSENMMQLEINSFYFQISMLNFLKEMGMNNLKTKSTNFGEICFSYLVESKISIEDAKSVMLSLSKMLEFSLSQYLFTFVYLIGDYKKVNENIEAIKKNVVEEYKEVQVEISLCLCSNRICCVSLRVEKSFEKLQPKIEELVVGLFEKMGIFKIKNKESSFEKNFACLVSSLSKMEEIERFCEEIEKKNNKEKCYQVLKKMISPIFVETIENERRALIEISCCDALFLEAIEKKEMEKGEVYWFCGNKMKEETMRDFLCLLMAKRGMKVDWKKIFGEEKRERALIASYPFSKKSFWNQLAHFELKKKDLDSFSIELPSESPYPLDEHVAYFKDIFAAAGHLSNILKKVNVSLNPSNVHFKRIDILSGIEVVEKVLVHYRFEKEEQNEWNFFGYDKYKNMKVIEGTFSVNETQKQTEIPEIPEIKPVPVFYRGLNEGIMCFGNSFKLLKETYLTKEECFTKLDDRFEGVSMTTPGLIDICFQAGFAFFKMKVINGAYYIGDESAVIYVPVSCENFFIDSQFNLEKESLVSYAKLLKEVDDTIILEVKIFSLKTNKVIFSIERLIVKAINYCFSKKLEMEENCNFFYEKSWIQSEITSSGPPVKRDYLILYEKTSPELEKLFQKLKKNCKSCLLLRQIDEQTFENEKKEKINVGHLDEYLSEVKELFVLNSNALFSVGWGFEEIISNREEIENYMKMLVVPMTNIFSRIKEKKINGNLLMASTLCNPQNTSSKSFSYATNQSEFQPNLLGSILWGISKALEIEKPTSKVMIVDFDEFDSDLFFKEILNLESKEKSTQISYRMKKRFVPKISKQTQYPTHFFSKESLGWCIKQKGSLNGMSVEKTKSLEISENQVVLEVVSSGVNFRDIVNCLGIVEEDLGELGNECSGIVKKVGKENSKFSVGDHVFGVVKGSWKNNVVADCDLLTKKPEWMSFNQSASIPIVFLTVYYIFNEMLKEKKFDSDSIILVHSAVGGIGLVTTMIAKLTNSKIYATTSSPFKRSFAKKWGVDKIFNSRCTKFHDEIKELTKGRGVDLVINSLSGEYITKSLDLLKEDGSFIEIGKRDLLSKEEFKKLKPEALYEIFDLSSVVNNDSKKISEMLSSIVDLFKEEKLQYLPVKSYPFEQAVEACRFMSSSSHIGKIVLTNRHNLKNLKIFDSQGYYLLTGAFGGIGRQVLSWMLKNGAKKFVLFQRRDNNQNEDEFVKQLENDGAIIQVIKIDLASGDILSALSSLGCESTPRNRRIRGVFHCAGIENSMLFERYEWNDYLQSFSPKILATLNLYKILQHYNLDFFVCFSSCASMVGSLGQVAYCAANQFMDSLASFHKGQYFDKCEHFLSINWGPWDKVGMAAKLHQTFREKVEENFFFIPPFQGIKMLEYLMSEKMYDVHSGQIGIFSINQKEKEREKKETSNPLEKIKKNANDLNEMIKKEIAMVTGQENVPLNVSWQEMGVDSIMSLELRNSLIKKTGVQLPSTFLFENPTLSSVLSYFSKMEKETEEDRIEKNEEKDEKIAIIGISSQFSSESKINARDYRLLACDLPDPILGKLNLDINLFDAEYFGISEKSAQAMDPQQRLLLHFCHSAIENSGYSVEEIKNTNTGIFICNSFLEYIGMMFYDKENETHHNLSAMTGNGQSINAGRLSYLFGLNGPSMVVDSACSSSLVALHLASQSILSGESPMAIAGAVNIVLNPLISERFLNVGMLSPDGKCKAFDSSANGYVRSEGCGVVVIKKLSQAIKDKDNIRAIIHGTSANHSGKSNGLTAPNGIAQRKAMKTALKNSGINSQQISFVEAHGTGTPLGDPIEMKSILEVYGKERTEENPLIIGSVKTNIGHCEVASGMAGKKNFFFFSK